VARVRRLGRIGRVAARGGAPFVIDRVRRRDPSAAAYERLAAGCQELGATFVKLGQLVASAPGLVGDDVATAFRPLLDQGRPVPFADVRRVVEADLGAPLAGRFADFSPEPLAAASLAVVHEATLPGGRRVAVKVLRPGIEGLVAADLGLVRPVADQLAAASGVRQAYLFLGLVEGLAEQLGEELDLRNEVAAMEAMRALLADLDEPRLTVPEPLPELSGRRVLTMELLDGVAIDDDAALAANGIDARPLLEAMVRAWFLGLIRTGTFHGDIHAGNVLLLRDGRAGILDWGIVGRLSPETHMFFRRMLDGVLGDESAWPDVARNLIGRFVPADHPLAGSVQLDDVAAIARERAHAFLTRPFGEVSLAEVMEGPPLPADLIEDRWPSLPVLAGRWAGARLRLPTRRVPPAVPDFDRGMFLLVKQLVYFERYGRRHMADRALFDDAELHRAVRALAP
jgi:predicted unusual protein kinase regulating ubiquinone biosynthesis (AarF/ABC1/UbiB family)